MLLITGIKYRLVPGDEAELTKMANDCLHNLQPGASMDEVAEARTIRHQIVHGRRFVSASGTEVMLAASDEVQQTIGLPFELFDKQRTTIESLKDEVEGLVVTNQKLKDKQRRWMQRSMQFEEMTWKQRLAFLFRGMKYKKLVQVED